MGLKELKWKCHVCGDERPDDKISVHTHTDDRESFSISCNIRYCNDRKKCKEGAPKVRFLMPILQRK